MNITDSAAEKLKKLIAETNTKDAGMRIFVSGGGCCGPSFGMDVAEKANSGDEVVEKNGLKFFVEKRAAARLSNATIDYIDSGARQGFTILGLSSSCCS